MPTRLAVSLLMCLIALSIGCSDAPSTAETQADAAAGKPKQKAVAKPRSRATRKKDSAVPDPMPVTRNTQPPVTKRVTTTPVVATKTETPQSAGQASWASWRGPNGNGISDETGLIRRFPKDGPNIVWRATLGTGFSGLAVAGGRVFTLFGEEQWVSRASSKGKLIIADGQMILISEYGNLMLAPVSAKGFHPTAKFRVVKGTCYTAPSLAGGKLYVRSNREMVCVDMRK